jgi:hypothetical protein
MVNVFQGPLDASVAPRWILGGHPHHERTDLASSGRRYLHRFSYQLDFWRWPCCQEVDVHARGDSHSSFPSGPPSSIITPADRWASRVSRSEAATSSWIRFTASLRRAAASRAMRASPSRSTWALVGRAPQQARVAHVSRDRYQPWALLLYTRYFTRYWHARRPPHDWRDSQRSLLQSAESVAQDDTQKRVCDLQPAVVLDESELPKPVHEEVHA